jgi:hypothetical protein
VKTYSELIEAMTVAQRLKRSRVMKQKSKLIARKREISMKKPPRLKQSIEKKADLKVKKLGGKWTKRLKPQVRAQMKDAYKTRMGKSSTAVLHDED